MQEVRYKDLGTIDYAECWQLQESIFTGIIHSKSGAENRQQNDQRGEHGGEKVIYEQTLILCEHPHVYTLGKSGAENNLLISNEFLQKIEATYYHIDRGGDITYHGPGQLVGYPILDLEQVGIGLREYIYSIEQAVIETVNEYGIKAGRTDAAAGVWLKTAGNKPIRKICAIGVRSSHYVTMHGFALNVNTDLGYFAHINPCGFKDRGVTSISKELGGVEVDMKQVKQRFISNFEKIINVKIK